MTWYLWVLLTLLYILPAVFIIIAGFFIMYVEIPRTSFVGFLDSAFPIVLVGTLTVIMALIPVANLYWTLKFLYVQHLLNYHRSQHEHFDSRQ